MSATERNVRVVFSAQDNLTGKTAEVGTQLRLMREHSESAGKGLGKVGNILGDISREALGATGPLGRVAEKLIEFGVGGGVFIAFAAGIAGIALLWDKLNEKTKKAREETDKLIESAFRASAIGKREETDKEIRLARQRVAELSEELAQNTRNVNTLGESFGMSKDKLEELNRKLFEARVALQELRGGAVELPELIVKAPKTIAKEVYGQITSTVQELARLDEAFDKDIEAYKKWAAIEERRKTTPFTESFVLGTKKEKPIIPGVDLGAINQVANDVGAATLDTLQKNSPAQIYQDALKPLQIFNDEMERQGGILTGLVNPAFAGTADAMVGIADALAKSGPGFGVVAKAASAASKVVAKIEGAIAIEKGGVKLAESLFPFNPAGFAAGAGMIAHGLKLAALGGGGGGSGSTGGAPGGGLNPAQAYKDQQALLQQKNGKTTIEFKNDRFLYDREDLQDAITQTLERAQARRV